MADAIRRLEASHVDEKNRSSSSSVQWFAEQLHATHPITHNNQLKVFVCGEESFADIAKHIENAKETIDLICWGFDPGMELVRGTAGAWPRGKTYGDLLIEAAGQKRHVKVRLLVWFDWKLCKLTRNMPGYTHGRSPWFTRSKFSGDDRISAQHSVAMLQEKHKTMPLYFKDLLIGPITPETIPGLAREEYCHSWYDAAMNGRLSGIEVRTRGTKSEQIARSIFSEQYQPASSLSALEVERLGLERAATHHQKTILIDFAYEKGTKAVGYVMGLNSVTNYWDTCEHKLEDQRRERGGRAAASEAVQGQEHDAGFLSAKPYQDYACRLDGGRALISLYNNFVTAWDRSIDDRTNTAANECMDRYGYACKSPPAALLRPARAGDSTVQIVRTQPEDKDKSIKDVYFLATDAACLAQGYLYVENQYFQSEEWSERLISTRRKLVADWKRACGKTGQTINDMPVMHVFIVTPVPEYAGMVPNTYDALAALGQEGGLTGQVELIKEVNKKRDFHLSRDARGVPMLVPKIPDIPNVVRHANEMEKRDSTQLENELRLKVSVAMLQTSAIDKGQRRFREIYIHSKLMLVDDVFTTLGSANLNQRSFAVDTELNIATTDAILTKNLRSRVWAQHSGGHINGGTGSRKEISDAFKAWSIQMTDNLTKTKRSAPMVGFLLPLHDKRSSTVKIS